MELKNYLYPLRRWWWLIAAATLAAALTSFLVTLGQPKVYMSVTTLMIGRAIEDPNPSSNDFYLSQRLAASYADIANREGVRNATMEALNLDWLPAYRARDLANSQLLEISVTDTNPYRAQVVANELAHQLILQTPTGSRPGQQEREAFVNQQLDLLQVQITQTRDDIDKLQADLGNMVSARQIDDTQKQIAALQGKLSTLQSNYANLLSNTQQGAVNTITVIEPAGLPKRPIGPNRVLSILIASVIGMVMAGGAAYVLEYLDDTMKTPQEIEKAIGYPIIGYIGETDSETNLPFVFNHPRHPMAETYRSLRTNLEFASVDKPLKTLVITSSDTGEGKTSVVTNLAVVEAQGEKNVVVMDADMRMPSMHKSFDMRLEPGLSEVFRGRANLDQALHAWKDSSVEVLPAGSIPPNPSELLASKKMDMIFDSLKESKDLVIVDGPPFIVTDAAVLADKVDGVLVVVRPGYARKAAVKSMMDQINRSKARVVGVVLNRIPRKLMPYYSGQLYINPDYYYGGGEYFDHRGEEPGDKKGKGFRTRLRLGRASEQAKEANLSNVGGQVQPAKRPGE